MLPNSLIAPQQPRSSAFSFFQDSIICRWLTLERERKHASPVKGRSGPWRLQPHPGPEHVARQAVHRRMCACEVHLSSPSGFCSFFFQSNGKPCPWSIPAQMISLVELAVVGVAADTQKETLASSGRKCVRQQCDSCVGLTQHAFAFLASAPRLSSAGNSASIPLFDGWTALCNIQRTRK